MAITLHQQDLPPGRDYGGRVAIDTETLGLKPHRDRLCVVQLSGGDGNADLVQIAKGQSSAPNLQRLLADRAVVKLFHFARFDIAVMAQAFGTMADNIYCTKIASKLVRTYTDRHGLKELCRELLGIDLSKQQQSSDWGASDLSEAQLAYAAPTCSTCMRCRSGSTGCSCGKAAGPRAGLLRFPPRPRAARSCGMAGRGYLLA